MLETVHSVSAQKIDFLDYIKHFPEGGGVFENFSKSFDHSRKYVFFGAKIVKK